MYIRIATLILLLIGSSLFLYAENTITILYTASLNGNLVGCDCRTHPRSGLVKSARFIREKNDNSILVDAGDFAARDNPGLSIEIANAYAGLGFDLVCIGDRELSQGLGMLADISKKIRLVSGNLRLSEGHPTIVGGPVVQTVGSFRVGFVPLIGQESTVFIPHQEEKSKIDVRDPFTEAKNELSLLAALKVDFTIIVYHGTREKCESMLGRLCGIDAAILAHSEELIDGVSVGNTVLVSPGEEGNRVGILLLAIDAGGRHSVSNSFRYFVAASDPDDKEIRERFDRYDKMAKAQSINGGNQ